MLNKKLFIIAGAAILLIIAGSAAFLLFKGKNSGQNNTATTQQNSGQTTTSTGGVTQAPPPAAATGFTIAQNPSQPFTNLKPRQGTTDEVAVQPKPVLQPNTNANPPTIGADDVTNPDYASLTDSQFLSKYYPSSRAVISGNDSASQNLNSQDPVLIDNSPPPTITVNPNVSKTLFKTTSNNDSQSILNYVTQLSNSTSSFDIVNNPNLFTDAVNDPSKIAASKTQAQNEISAIEAVPVPDSVLGMSQDYVAYYQAYVNFLNDYQNFTGSGSDAQVNSQAASLQHDMDVLTSRLGQVNNDIITVGQLVQ